MGLSLLQWDMRLGLSYFKHHAVRDDLIVENDEGLSSVLESCKYSRKKVV